MPSPIDAATFEHARQRFADGLGHLLTRRFEDAEHAFVESLALLPGRTSTLVNLALARLELGRGAAALETADEVLTAEPDNAEAHFHRAAALQLLGRHEDVLAACQRALVVGSPAGATWLRHGQSLQALGRQDAALAAYASALDADASLAQAWTNRGTILRELGRSGEAAHAFRQALAHGGDEELHAYYLAAIGAGDAPAIAPPHYVQALFDTYADDFDAHLVETLGYDAHRVLIDPIASLGRGPFASALDLGCGTGLCGPLLERLVARLEGVDLSPRMLAKASELGVYDRLMQADIADHLAASDEQHDLLVAADVFIYIGDLEPIFAGARRVLRTGGLFCFSAELAEDTRAAFKLQSSLRYAQSEGHLRALAERHGFDVVRCAYAPIRQEQREAIAGIFMYLAART